jgi:hypothetical protein
MADAHLHRAPLRNHAEINLLQARVRERHRFALVRLALLPELNQSELSLKPATLPL